MQNSAKKSSSKWESVKKGALVQRLWDKHEWPQVAVLKLSANAFDAFMRNPANFMNANRIFPVKVQRLSGPAASLNLRFPPTGPQIVVIVHKRPSKTPIVIISGDPYE